MGTEIAQRSTQYAGEDRRWLDGGFHGQDTNKEVTLNGDLFPAATYPDGRVPSGIVLGIVTATGLAGPYGGRTNEVQSVNLGAATAGTITIGFDGETTAAIAFNASAADVQAALQALSNIGPGDVAVTGGPLPGTVTLTFAGQYAGMDVPTVVVTPTGLTGGTVTVTTVTAGGSAVTDGRQTAVGHLLNTETVRAGAQVLTAVVRHGVVNENLLPAGSLLDAAAKADLPYITYQTL